MDAGEVSPAAVAEVFRNLTLMLAPFAPFLAAELWETMGGEGAVFRAAWPVADAGACARGRGRDSGADQRQARDGDSRCLREAMRRRSRLLRWRMRRLRREWKARRW